MNGADKPLLELGGIAIIEHVLQRARSQVDKLVINVNRNPDLYIRFDLPVLPDCITGYGGPMVGILTAMKWALLHEPTALAIACFPGDVPWFPDDVVDRLSEDLCDSKSEIAWLSTDGQLQPLFSLWSVSLMSEVECAINNGMYSPMQFILSRRHRLIEYNNSPPGFFYNLNCPDDILNARKLIRRQNLPRTSPVDFDT